MISVRSLRLALVVPGLCSLVRRTVRRLWRFDHLVCTGHRDGPVVLPIPHLVQGHAGRADGRHGLDHSGGQPASRGATREAHGAPVEG